MKTTTRYSVIFLFVFFACAEDEHHHHHHHTDVTSVMDMSVGDSCSDKNLAICVSLTQISQCDGTVLGAPEECPSGEECMTMPDGLTHCMDMSGM